MSGERNVVADMIAVAQTGFVLAKVLLVVGLAMAIFATAYLGYFILPFIFVLMVFSIVGMGGLLKHWARIRGLLRNDR